MNSLIIFLILKIFSKILSEERTFITIPFSFNYIKFVSNYNSTNFFNDYFKKEIFLQFNIGTPPKEIKSLIEQNSNCLKFKKDKSDLLFSDTYRYSPIESSTFFKSKNPVIYSPMFQVSFDKFNFPGTNKSYSLEFLIDNYTKNSNMSYLSEVGLSIPFWYTGIQCPNLILDLKNDRIIKKLIWSLKYNDQFGGDFIIGDELSIYNPTKFPELNYSTIYLTYKHNITFDAVYSMDKWPNYKNKDNNDLLEGNFNITDSFININFGVIIGTSEYKKYIDQKIFDMLIKKQFCKIDIITFNSTNSKDNKFNGEYYVYSCYDKFFTGQISERHPSTNYFNYFPSLVFTSKQLEYNFELINKNLFEHILDRYYFLVVFKKNENSKEIDEKWYLGEPFYKKYPFSINPDAKTIGFYIERDRNIIIKDKKGSNTTDNINDDSSKEKSQMNKIVKYLIVIIVLIVFVGIAYYIGVTVRERRKKRANELKDDNYEYLSEKDKNINSNSNETNSHQFVELNSRLGL